MSGTILFAGQAPGHDSEVYLVPRAIYRDPFRRGDNILVMCDCYEPPRLLPDGSVTPMKVGAPAISVVSLVFRFKCAYF